MRYFYTTLLLLSCSIFSAQAVTIDAINFPDAQFRNYVTATFDLDMNGDLDAAEAAAATTVNMQNNLLVANLTGLHHLTGLQDLFMTNCSALTGSPDLSAAPNLDQVRLDGTAITGITTNGTANFYSSLRELFLQNCGSLTAALDISNMPALTRFRAYSSSTSSITTNSGASYYPSLTQFYVYNNSSLTGGIDISNMPSLISLQFQNCNVTSLTTNSTPGYYTNLTQLRISGNGSLTGSLDISEMPDLINVYAQNCNLTSLVTNAGANFYPALQRLQCHGNPNLTGAVSIENMPALRFCYFNATAISSFTANATASYYTSMSTLRLQGNSNLTGTVDISGMPTVSICYAFDINISNFVTSATADYYSNLRYLYLRDNSNMAVSVSIANMPALERLYAQSSGITGVTANGTANYYSAMNQLYVYNSGSATGDLDISGMPTLTRLHAYNCNFTSFTSSATADYYSILNRIYLFGNSNLASSVDISNMPVLQLCRFEDCNLSGFTTNAAGGYYTAMDLLYIDNNPNLTAALDISNMATITRLYANDCDITALTMGGNTLMERVYVYNNSNLTGTLNFTSMSSLQQVRAQNCAIDSIVTGNAATHPSTTQLRFQNNNLGDVSTLVDLASASLTDIRVQGNQLDCDDLADIKLMDINMGGDGQTPWDASNVYNSAYFRSQQGPLDLLNDCPDSPIWTGDNSSDWNDAGNWSGSFPTCSLDAIIPDVSGASGNFPELSSGATGAVRDINIMAGASLTIADGFELQVCGDWTNEGTADVGEGLITYQGSSEQTIDGSTNYGDFTLNNANNANFVNGSFEVTGVMTLTDGTLSTNNALTFISDISGTGSLAELGATAGISGQITMQRYIPAGATNWRFMTMPVQSATLAQYSGDFITSVYTGSDFPSFSFTSVYFYDETTAGGVMDNGYVAATNSGDAVPAFEGLWVWCGDASGGTAAFTTDVTGLPFTGSQSRAPSYTNTGNPNDDGWNMYGNPYPSDIDWTDITHSGIENRYWIYDPQSGNTAVWDEGTQTGQFGANGDIASSQAFWIHATGSASFSINENAKTTGAAPIFSVQNPLDIPMVTFQVSSNINTFYDETIIRFDDQATDNYEVSRDAMKVFSGHWDAPRLTSQSLDGVDMSINSYGELTQAVNIPLKVLVPITGTYELSVSDFHQDLQNQCLTLEDLVTGTITTLDSNTVYSFAIEDTVTMPRFILHIADPYTTASTAATCHGYTDGQIIAQGAGNGPWDYIWTDDQGAVIQQSMASTTGDTLNNLSAGTYNLTVATAQSCGGATDVFIIDEPVDVIADFTAPDTVNIAVSGMVDFVNNSAGALDYTWDFGDGSPQSTAINPTYTYQAVGDYLVMLEAISGVCPDTAYRPITVVDDHTGIGEITTEGPSAYIDGAGQVVIGFNWNSARDVQVNIYNGIGQQLMPTQRVNIQSGQSFFQPSVNGNQVLLIEITDLEENKVYYHKLLY